MAWANVRNPGVLFLGRSLVGFCNAFWGAPSLGIAYTSTGPKFQMKTTKDYPIDPKKIVGPSCVFGPAISWEEPSSSDPCYAPEGVKYNMTVSIDPHVNEYIAIFYRTDKLRMLKSESYYDPEKFYRKPFFLLFDSPTLRDMKRFGLIGYHVKPSQAVREIDALADVYDFMKDKYDIEDILIMGDFNADCDYVKEQNWDSISLWTRHEFTWAIPRTEDTTTNYRSCALDRIVYAGENMNSGVILSSAGAFDYRYEFDVTMEEARSISDHWPVEICFIIHGFRKPKHNPRKDSTKLAKLPSSKPMSTTIGFLIRNGTREFRPHVGPQSQAENALPEAITNEQSEAILLKPNNGWINDESALRRTATRGLQSSGFQDEQHSEITRL
ncbi:Deoxyribonuclease-1-like 2 like protein [Argiope bruennichi]|uniref:Deoxyribonuclease-1-like 2 like protein n=1 Tax=Argiope bruennichi TaxID=94029 RepID=A0A8T0E7G6_ARGBR|nr:Deoxyribonuclease-1-like 2 like protein [Argiope bruennichi]